MTRRSRGSEAGFTLPEVLVTLVIVGVLSTLSGVAFLNYVDGAALRGGADQLALTLDRGRQLAITRNTKVCVEQNGTIVRYHVGPTACAEAVWIGPGTAGDGSITLANNVQVSAATASVVFDRLGAANVATTYTVRNPTTGNTATVAVSTSGRVKVNGP